MATRIEELYERGLSAWTQAQAEALRRLGNLRPNLDLDFFHLIEEVSDLGTSQRDTGAQPVAPDHRALPEAGRLRRVAALAVGGTLRSSTPVPFSTTS